MPENCFERNYWRKLNHQIRGIVEELRHRPNLPFKDSIILSTEQKQVFVNKWLKEKLKSGQSDFVLAYHETAGIAPISTVFATTKDQLLPW